MNKNTRKKQEKVRKLEDQRMEEEKDKAKNDEEGTKGRRVGNRPRI